MPQWKALIGPLARALMTLPDDGRMNIVEPRPGGIVFGFSRDDGELTAEVGIFPSAAPTARVAARMSATYRDKRRNWEEFGNDLAEHGWNPPPWPQRRFYWWALPNGQSRRGYEDLASEVIRVCRTRLRVPRPETLTYTAFQDGRTVSELHYEGLGIPRER